VPCCPDEHSALFLRTQVASIAAAPGSKSASPPSAAPVSGCPTSVHCCAKAEHSATWIRGRFPISVLSIDDRRTCSKPTAASFIYGFTHKQMLTYRFTPRRNLPLTGRRSGERGTRRGKLPSRPLAEALELMCTMTSLSHFFCTAGIHFYLCACPHTSFDALFQSIIFRL
jgi:hypothetical protein